MVEDILRGIPKYLPRLNKQILNFKGDNAYVPQIGQVGTVGPWIMTGVPPADIVEKRKFVAGSVH